jgi:hypothetical protein
MKKHKAGKIEKTLNDRIFSSSPPPARVSARVREALAFQTMLLFLSRETGDWLDVLRALSRSQKPGVFIHLDESESEEVDL